MTEKKVRIKIYSQITDISAINIAEKIMGEENAYEAAQDDIIEYSTEGSMREKGNIIELEYAESTEMGMENSVTTLLFPKDEPNSLNMVRKGENSAGFIFSDKEKRQPCSYTVGGFPFDFCIYTRSIDNGVTMSGGTIKLDYVIEINGVKTQRNRFTIIVNEIIG